MIYRYLPRSVKRVLWGDRDRYGVAASADDPEWKEWHEKHYLDFYAMSQHAGAGDRVCRWGYPVIRRVPFLGKRVLEIGPGIIRHLPYMQNEPSEYCVCDVRQELLDIATSQLQEAGIASRAILIQSADRQLPFDDEEFDVVLSFYSLEHLHPLDEYLVQIQRVMKHGGMLVGAIPCEGGLAWGLGRALTTRRHVQKTYGLNYDKLICWDHPNFAEFVLQRLESYFRRQYTKLSPFSWLPMDLNLVLSFVFSKKAVQPRRSPRSNGQTDPGHNNAERHGRIGGTA